MEGPIRTTMLARFGRFAAGHFLLSICTNIVCLGLLALLVPLLQFGQEPAPQAYIVLVVILMGAYFPVGAYTAARQGWTRPSGWLERILAVFLPALVAWAWEGLMIAGLFGSSGRVYTSLVMIFISLSFFLAFPSTFFVFFCTLNSLTWPLGSWHFFLVAIMAGLLPPLLFAAGSFWQAWKEECPHDAKQQRNQVF